jgi:hypothetical protein
MPQTLESILAVALTVTLPLVIGLGVEFAFEAYRRTRATEPERDQKRD